MKAVQKLVTQDSFDANGVLIPAGHVGTFDEERLNGKEAHLHDISDMPPTVPIEMAAIGPTGPNPKQPQQIPAGAVQGPGGEYLLPGKRLVGEVTDPQTERLDDRGLRDVEAEDKVNETLTDIMGDDASLADGSIPATVARTTAGTTEGNADDALVAGNVSEVTADLGTKTDEQLEAIRAAETDRERPRAGVLNAVDAELEARKLTA